MGALDFLKEFEGRALDAASYKLLRRNFEMQEENNRLLQEKAQLLQCKIENMESHTQKIEQENKELKNSAVDTKFKIYEGFAFQRGLDGLFEDHPFCPNCKTIMSNPMHLIYVCSKCNYNHKTRNTPKAFAKQLNEK